MATETTLDTAVLGSGCFWCTEAVFAELAGVHSVTSGYSGGSPPQPTYEQVCSGQTGHAECVRIEFDPKAITYADILTVFFYTHDPTTRNRQGNDVGTQYRSVIFYQDASQKSVAEETIARLNAAGDFSSEIVTEVVPAQPFFSAESYHQEYFATHPTQPYCAAVIGPKLHKFRSKFQQLRKRST